MKKIIGRSLGILMTVIVLLSLSLTVHAEGYYSHDPMENPKAAADIIVDPDAVYGYAPNPDSPRLGVYADYDWSDPAFVEEMRQERLAYHASIKELYQIKADMENAGASVEEIARAVSTRRNELRMEFYQDDPEGLQKLKESNLKTFGNENGGTPDYFYEKYGSWETVIEKSFSTNAGADACLGLYDQFYDTYIFDTQTGEDTGGSTDSPTEEPTAEPSANPEPSAKPETPAASTQDSPKKSPNTEDPTAAVILLMVVMTGVTVTGMAAIKRSKPS